MSAMMDKWKQVAPGIAADIQKVLEKHGVGYVTHRATVYPDGRVDMKLTLNQAGTAEDLGKSDFENYCVFSGLKPEDFGKTFRSGGEEYKISGWAPKKFKRPLIAKNVRNGKSFVFPPEDVVRLLKVA
jgi:hypothetical protein